MGIFIVYVRCKNTCIVTSKNNIQTLIEPFLQMMLSIIFINSDSYITCKWRFQYNIPFPNDLFKTILCKINNFLEIVVQINKDVFVIRIIARTIFSMHPIIFHNSFYRRSKIGLLESIPFSRIESLFVG